MKRMKYFKAVIAAMLIVTMLCGSTVTASAASKRIKAVTTKSSSIKFITRKSYKKGIYYTGTLAANVKVYVIGAKGRYYLVRNASGSAYAYVPKSALRRAK